MLHPLQHPWDAHTDTDLALWSKQARKQPQQSNLPLGALATRENRELLG